MIALLCASGLAACGDNDNESGSSAGTSNGSGTGASGGKIDDSKPPARFALISIKVPGVDILTPFQAGAEAAAKKINDMGGLGGREVVIDTCNSMLQPAVATTCAHKTLEKDPIAEFGCEVSWSTSGLKIYANAKVPSFNCLNTEEDFANPWSFGINPGAFGYQRGMANWACENPDIEKVVVVTQDIPQQHRDAPKAVQPVLEGCGKEVEFVYYPITAADLTQSITQVVQAEPDFVFNQVGSGASVVQFFKGYQQAGLTGSKLGGPDTIFDYEGVMEQAGSVMDGTYSFSGFDSWGDTENPDVTEYLDAMEGSSVDARNFSAEWGYHSVMWFYTVAKQVGFDKFDSASLTEFMKTQTGVEMPLSKELVNPGPNGYPQVKQPYVQVSQWQDGKSTPVTDNTDEGWVSGF